MKFIAGDDILTPECIKEFVEATKTCDDKIMICGTLHFSDGGEKAEKRIPCRDWFDGDARYQERTIVRKGTIIEGPTLFLHRQTLESLGGFEEKYPFIEDYPLCMKYLAHGYRINLLPKHLIRYRVYPQSVSRSDNRFASSIFNAIEDYAGPAALRNHMYLHWWHETIQRWFRHYSIPRMFRYMIAATDFVNLRNKWKSYKQSITSR